MTRVLLILLLAAVGASAQEKAEESNEVWKWANFGILAVFPIAYRGDPKRDF
jgi:hypothetical protein